VSCPAPPGKWAVSTLFIGDSDGTHQSEFDEFADKHGQAGYAIGNDCPASVACPASLSALVFLHTPILGSIHANRFQT
jgi:hypothetical protein